MTAVTGPFELPDGRTLDVFLGGDEDGFPLVMHHGTPSDSTAFGDWDEPCRERGLRLICASRPGYATSTRLPGRDVAHAARDTAHLLDLLGHDAFLTAGASGGGPHALACAALLHDRCRAATTLAGFGPYGRDDLDFLADMGPENVEEYGVAAEGEEVLTTWLADAEPLRHVTGEQIAEALGDLLPQIDVDVLEGRYADQIAASTRRALEHGFDGWVDDDLAFTRPWGFDVGVVRRPVTVWQGDLDRIVPFAHGRWLADHLPRATERMVPGHGHISLVTSYRDEILDDLRDAASNA